MVADQQERTLLKGVFSVRKGKTQLHKWAERQVILCGTCLIVASVKDSLTGKMHILPLVGGKVRVRRGCAVYAGVYLVSPRCSSHSGLSTEDTRQRGSVEQLAEVKKMTHDCEHVSLYNPCQPFASSSKIYALRHFRKMIHKVVITREPILPDAKQCVRV